MLKYFQRVLVLRATSQKEDSWKMMREGTTLVEDEKIFSEGSVYACFLAPYPGASQYIRDDLNFSEVFYTHTSPFALLMKAFRTLHVWDRQREGLGGLPPPSCHSSELLYTALRCADVPEPRSRNIVKTVDDIYGTIKAIIAILMTDLADQWLGGGPDHGSTRSSKGSQRKEPIPFSNFGDRSRDNGLATLQFSSSDGASNHQESPRATPQEGMEFFLSVTDGSTPSRDDDAKVTSEPNAYDPCSGPSPVQASPL